MGLGMLRCARRRPTLSRSSSRLEDFASMFLSGLQDVNNEEISFAQALALARAAISFMGYVFCLEDP